MIRFALGFAAAACMASAPLLAQEPRVFTQSGPWTADFGDDYCRLARTFSNGEDTISLAFERIAVVPKVTVLVVGDSIQMFRGAERIGFHFLPNNSPFEASFSRSETPDGQQLLMISDLNVWSMPQLNLAFEPSEENPETVPSAPPFPVAPPVGIPGFEQAELDQAAQVTGILLRQGLTAPVQLNTGSLRAAFEVLQSCSYDLLQSWGLDAEKHRTMQRGAMPYPARLISNRTVPFQENSRLVGGNNQVRIMVSSEGNPTSCHIHTPTLSERVNERICEQVMTNARFNPARDAEGQPMASYWTAPVGVLYGPPSLW